MLLDAGEEREREVRGVVLALENDMGRVRASARWLKAEVVGRYAVEIRCAGRQGRRGPGTERLEELWKRKAASISAVGCGAGHERRSGPNGTPPIVCAEGPERSNCFHPQSNLEAFASRRVPAQLARFLQPCLRLPQNKVPRC